MTTGTNELLSNLLKLEVQNKRAARKAVNDGAELFAKNLKENTPEETGVLSSSVIVTGFKGANQGLIEKDIGFKRSVGFRVKYPNTGTVYQRPQNFVEKTIKQSTTEVLKIYEDSIIKGLKL
ncbi:HK97-gp10 family putative phage morphogenesis protein [Carnobacterium sp. ISL-102]|uniref:HK97-gp10 family putative phage morphogenesis protein n=1 Tax=Carnobacterium sp. ISL-102 TaxID=2819142 RepID=UPI001BE70614|nr:HK97-gp10 family putative phage morphogenesis protein [Carnobacterium sp. ISL-102]MBT2732117.1 HK97 gp10 family phage protein [Carnobacterium sp. ISL-102]